MAPSTPSFSFAMLKTRVNWGQSIIETDSRYGSPGANVIGDTYFKFLQLIIWRFFNFGQHRGYQSMYKTISSPISVSVIKCFKDSQSSIWSSSICTQIWAMVGKKRYTSLEHDPILIISRLWRLTRWVGPFHVQFNSGNEVNSKQVKFELSGAWFFLHKE